MFDFLTVIFQEDVIALNTAKLLFETATLRSGYALKDQVGFAERIETVLKKNLNIDLDLMVCI
jgi:heat shock protein beta